MPLLAGWACDVPMMWRWVCAAVDLENPRDNCEVPPHHHGVVAAAHTGTFVWP